MSRDAPNVRVDAQTLTELRTLDSLCTIEGLLGGKNTNVNLFFEL